MLPIACLPARQFETVDLHQKPSFSIEVAAGK